MDFVQQVCLVLTCQKVVVMFGFMIWSALVLLEGFLAQEPMSKYLKGFFLGFSTAYALAWKSPEHFGLNLFLFSALFICAVFDYIEMMVPQSCSLLPAAFFIAFSWFNLASMAFYESVFSIVFILGIMLPVRFLFVKLKHHNGLGAGDIQVFVTVASILGVQSTLMVIQLSAILGLVSIAMYKMLTHKPLASLDNFAFTPYIAIATVVVAVFKVN